MVTAETGAVVALGAGVVAGTLFNSHSFDQVTELTWIKVCLSKDITKKGALWCGFGGREGGRVAYGAKVAAGAAAGVGAGAEALGITELGGKACKQKQLLWYTKNNNWSYAHYQLKMNASKK